MKRIFKLAKQEGGKFCSLNDTDRKLHKIGHIV